MKIIVISITPYKEKDGIVNAISKDGAISFLARSILDPKNKNSAINNNLVIADVDLAEGKIKYPILKTCEILTTPMALNSSLDTMASIMLIAEATKELIQDDEKVHLYDTLLEAIESFKVTKEPIMTALIYLTRVFKYTGYEFQTNECVFCGSKRDIMKFSFADGGFVCKNCLENSTSSDLTNEQMLLLRSAFNAKDYKQVSQYYTKENAVYVLHKMFDFVADSYGYIFKSAALFNI